MLKGKGLVGLLGAVVLFSGFSSAVTPDRILGTFSGAKVALRGNVHGLARPEFDLGRANSSRLIQGVSLAFRPWPAQQKDLDTFIAQLGDRKSPNYHKYLTPAQFGERFGLSLNDIAKITTWLRDQGFTNIKVANSRNQISFDGTVEQIESTFAVEIHHYAVDGVVHLANAGEPAIPAILGGAVIGVGHLNDFAPKPRTKIQSHLTSYVSGNHFLTPADFATIYNLGPLYAANVDGAGQKIAIIGQSTVSTTDLNNFRTAAGLPASSITVTTAAGTLKKCSGDEGESDLDIEWAGGVAKRAQIIFVVAGVGSGQTCDNRTINVWDALQYAVDHNVAPVISTSYGFCESGLGSAFSSTVQGWAKQAISHGQTIVAASGDAGAADCESINSTSATTALAVDVPASIPEVTGAGGNEFTGDAQATVTGTAPNTTAGATQYWDASNAGSDVVDTALSYIPEMAWNDTTQSLSSTPPGGLSASGGGASIYFCSGPSPCITGSGKPTWQTGPGVPADGKRDVPDISISSSNFHDPYLVCSEDGSSTPCASGFRDGAGGNFFAVGGTSAAAPTFAAILALVNQYTGGNLLPPINPTLYSLAASNPSVFHDITSGDNKVPCTTGSTTDCSSGTMGFAAGPGYDQVTGLGSVDAFALAQALTPFSLSASALSPASVPAGTSATSTITVTPDTGFTGTVSFSCSGLPTGGTCNFTPTTLTNGSGTTQLTIQTLANTAAGTTSVTVKGASGTASASTTVSLAVTKTPVSFSLEATSSLGTLSVAQGQTSQSVSLNVKSSSNPSFVSINGSGSTTLLPVTYTCVGLPNESACNFSPASTTSSTTVTFSVTTTAPTASMRSPFERKGGIFYAVLLSGLFGIVFVPFSGRHSSTATRCLILIVALGLSVVSMSSCGGTSNTKNPGTPTGTYPITVNATTGGAAPLTSSFAFTLSVTQ